MLRTAIELCLHVHSMKWFSKSVSRLAERAAALCEPLEAAYAAADESRKRRSIKVLSLAELGWKVEHKTEVRDLREQLSKVTCLAHRDSEQVSCVHTGSSDKHWAVCATQRIFSELSQSVINQVQQSLAFLSGTFSSSRMYWSSYEPETFAVVQNSRELDCLLACNPKARVTTDHPNFLCTFNPAALKPSPGRRKNSKVHWLGFVFERFQVSYTTGSQRLQRTTC